MIMIIIMIMIMIMMIIIIIVIIVILGSEQSIRRAARKLERRQRERLSRSRRES